MSNQAPFPARSLTDKPVQREIETPSGKPTEHATDLRQTKALARKQRQKEKHTKGRAADRQKPHSPKASVPRSVPEELVNASLLSRTRPADEQPPFRLYQRVVGDRSKTIYVADTVSKEVEVVYLITLFTDLDAAALQGLQDHFDRARRGSGYTTVSMSATDGPRYTSQIWAPIKESTGEIVSKEAGFTSVSNILYCLEYKTLVDLDTVDGIVEVRWRGLDGAHKSTPGGFGRGFTRWEVTSEVCGSLKDVMV